MSDNEESGSEAAPVEASDTQSPTSLGSPSSPDVATDVAPTRRARRRPEPKPAEVVEEKSTEEEQPAKIPTETTVAQGGWGSWGSWGKSLLSTATATVATVGQGLSQVIEKAETSLGIPSPTELSAQVEEEEREQMESSTEAGLDAADAASAVESAMGMLTSLTSAVQITGKTVLSGGLDALEFIGKKTMDVIAEGDPGFKKTKGLMNRNLTLSQVLREAKEREEQQTEDESMSEKKPLAHYGVLFDQFQGLSHLEALEILSRDSESKVKSVLTTLSGDEQQQLREELKIIKDSFSMMDFDDDELDEKHDQDGAEFQKELEEVLEGITVSGPVDKLCKASKGARNQALVSSGEGEDQKTTTVEDIHAAGIRSLAELTAGSIELFHKLAEMILTARVDPAASVLSQLTVVLCRELSLLSRKFTSSLTSAASNEKGDVLNPLITGVFLEASNSVSYIQDAFQLLRPILEVSHIQRRSLTAE
ncbi:protein FAM114A2 [Synchiropus picturatus]